MAFFGELLLLEILVNEQQRLDLYRQRRYLRDTSDPMNLPNGIFKSIFRVNKEVANRLIHEVGPHMNDSVRRTLHIPKNLRIFCVLHFLAQGDYQKGVGQDHLYPMSQASVSNCLREVVPLIVDILGYIIQFPRTDEEKQREKLGFMDMNLGFPGIIGCIDCTHVGIVAPPTEDPEQPGVIFYNRKGFYSLNVQIICNANLKILNINARFPGSVHDAAIWQTSTIKRHLRQNYNEGQRNSYLLGDSGYPLEPWLLTPILRPNGAREVNYNIAHKAIRNVVERCNGVLKQRFRCILRHRILHYEPTIAANIVYVCAILHNACIGFNDVLEDYEENRQEDGDVPEFDGEDQLANGAQIREAVLNAYFN